MSKSRQHWQEDSNDYTFNQYTFYLIVLGLLLAGMIYWYLDSLNVDIPKTHFVSIVCEHGDDLPVIPYQDEDFTAIKKLVPGAQLYSFNDASSFGEEIETLKKVSEDYQEIDSVLVWFSAVGSVSEDNQPVILDSGGKEIEFSVLIDSFEQLNATNVIVMLDCNHGCVNPKAYNDNSAPRDINAFPDRVAEVLQQQSGKVKFVLYGLAGEKPVHSFLRRRSLFGFAIENAFLDRDVIKWNGQDLIDSLESACRNFADKSAPRLKWYGDDELATEFHTPDLDRPDPPEEDEEKKPFAPNKVATTALDKTNRVWKEFESVRKDLTKRLGPDNTNKVPLLPTTIDPIAWRALNQQMADLSAIALRSPEEHLDKCNQIREACGDFLNENDNRIDAIVRRIDLVEPPSETDLSPAEREAIDEQKAKRDIRIKYQEIHAIYFRLQHYLAVADSLSWILPGHGTIVDRLCRIPLVENIADKDLENEIWVLPTPSLNQASEIDRLHKDATELDIKMQQRLAGACEIIPQLKGFQQEMVVEALLRLPFLEVEKDDESGSRNSLPSRNELVQMVLDSDLENSKPDKRYSEGEREEASKIRIGMYEAQEKIFGSAREQNSASRELQLYAYRLPSIEFDFERLTVRDRTRNPIVRVNNLKKLEDGIFIESEATPVDLGLVIENIDKAAVSLECTIIQADENGTRFFGFPGTEEDRSTFDGNTKPQLVAYRDSTGMDPSFSCFLSIRIVNKNDSSELHEPFTIPIKLPSLNQIELLVDFGDQPTTYRKDSKTDPDPVYPFANRELICNFGIRNQWHKERKGTITLYACAKPSTPTVPGKINDEVRQKTLDALKKAQLTAIAASAFTLAGTVNEEAKTQKVKWTLPEGVEEPVPVATDHGFLIVIDKDSDDNDWHYWVPVFPRQLPVVDIVPQIDSDNLKIRVQRASFFPDEFDAKIRWYFSDFRNLGEGVLGTGANAIDLKGAKSISQRCKSGDYLYVDVDGWPRKFVFKYNGNQFVEAPMTNDAGLEIKLGLPGAKPPKEDPLVLLGKSSKFDKIYGTKEEAKNVTVQLSPNVPASAFSFSEARDHILLKESNRGKLFYPRQIKTVVSLAPKSGNVLLTSNVSDYEIPFEVMGGRFEIGPSIILGNNSAKRLSGSNRIQIQVDNKPPTIESSQCQVITSSIQPDKRVAVRLKIADEGVGIDMKSGVQLFLSEPGGNLTDLKNKLPSQYRNGTFQFAAPKAGKYKIGVRLTDRVKNSEDYTLRNNLGFTVRAPRGASTGGGKKKAVKHTLTVELSANATELSNIDKLEVKIKPEDANAEINGDKYIFRNLKEGVSYTVTASGELASGFAKGRKLSGKTPSKSFPKNSKSSQNVLVKLKMK